MKEKRYCQEGFDGPPDELCGWCGLPPKPNTDHPAPDVDRCPVCTEPCHASEGTSDGLHPRCAGLECAWCDGPLPVGVDVPTMDARAYCSGVCLDKSLAWTRPLYETYTP